MASPRRKRELVSLTGWVNPERGYKQRIQAVKGLDHRYSESRVVEECIEAWLPNIERRVGVPNPPAPARPTSLPGGRLGR